MDISGVPKFELSSSCYIKYVPISGLEEGDDRRGYIETIKRFEVRNELRLDRMFREGLEGCEELTKEHQRILATGFSTKFTTNGDISVNFPIGTGAMGGVGVNIGYQEENFSNDTKITLDRLVNFFKQSLHTDKGTSETTVLTRTLEEKLISQHGQHLKIFRAQMCGPGFTIFDSYLTDKPGSDIELNYTLSVPLRFPVQSGRYYIRDNWNSIVCFTDAKKWKPVDWMRYDELAQIEYTKEQCYQIYLPRKDKCIAVHAGNTYGAYVRDVFEKRLDERLNFVPAGNGSFGIRNRHGKWLARKSHQIDTYTWEPDYNGNMTYGHILPHHQFELVKYDKGNEHEKRRTAKIAAETKKRNEEEEKRRAKQILSDRVCGLYQHMRSAKDGTVHFRYDNNTWYTIDYFRKHPDMFRKGEKGDPLPPCFFTVMKKGDHYIIKIGHKFVAGQLTNEGSKYMKLFLTDNPNGNWEKWSFQKFESREADKGVVLRSVSHKFEVFLYNSNMREFGYRL